MFAVEVDNISKVYRFYQKPVHRLLEAISRKSKHVAFSALKNVKFSVPVGSTLGIVGENGAGKSTLLKILAKTLVPSSGQVYIRGRVAALLELGAGFHQELTGRQNIFLNASLLGLADNDIKDKEEDIILFSELKEFIDRPLRSYSSGMVIRLAFAIATCVEPDILIIDEALSVGDVHFQRKCIQRMQRFRDSGKTLIFCSHSMYQVNELCSEAIWLDKGTVRAKGRSSNVISDFMNCLDSRNAARETDTQDHAPPRAQAEAFIKEMQIVNQENKNPTKISEFDDLQIRIVTKSREKGFKGHIGVAIFDPEDQMVFGTSTKHSGYQGIELTAEQIFEIRLNSMPIKRGSFKIKAFILDQECLRVVDEYGTRDYMFISERPDLGYLRIEHVWTRIGEDL